MNKIPFALMLSFLLFFLLSPPAQAANFSVSDATSLIAAMNTANSNGEDDVITLTANITLTLLDNTTDGDNGLPSILPDGANSLTIDGAGFTISRDGAAPQFRILHISAGASLSLSNLSIQNGEYDAIGSRGGGIGNNGSLTVSNSTISGNTGYLGGGIGNNGSLTVSNSTISGNTANVGGGIYSRDTTTLTVINSDISGNTANSQGGAIYNTGNLTMSNSTISENLSQSAGGIFNRGIATVSNSTISENDAITNGGGINNVGPGILTLTNSTISGNTVTRGAGIYNSGTATVSNSTISENFADEGGGIYNSEFIDPATMTLNNSIVAGNTVLSSGAECFLDSGTFDADANNLFGTDGTGGGCTVGASDLSPNTALSNILSPLADNGGATETHALIAGSLAIDASGAGATTSDQRGAAIFNVVRDIGAYEYDALVPLVSIALVSASNIIESGGLATITVTVSNLTTGSLTVLANISGGTATENGDYTITPSLTFNADGSQDFTITALVDALIEGNENLSVNFSLIGAADISGNGEQTVTIIEPVSPSFSKAFAPSTIVLAGTTSLTLTIDNTANPIDATGLDFTDNLPAGIIIASPANESTTCTGGTITAVSGSGIISYTGSTVTAGTTCTVQVDVTGILVGTHTNITGDLTSNLGNSGTATADLTVNPSLSSPASPAQNTVSGEPSIGVFDPAISKLGLLVPGQVGVTGEELEWIVTVSNTGSIVGQNVVVTDTLIPALRVDRVDAPNATLTINGQTVTVVYATLNVGETVQFSIFTTVLNGVTVDNTACVTASNQGAEECVTALPISQLPSTGESPFWRYALLMRIALLLGASAIILLYRKAKIIL